MSQEKYCLSCNSIFRQGADEGPKRFARRAYCSNACANTSHRMSRTPEYRVWLGMLNRCRNPRDSAFHKYGAKGVSVCQRWHSFEAFIADMGLRPSDDHSIDRIDGSKDYAPDNCRWATREEQQNNLRNNVNITIGGETLTASQWDRRKGWRRGTVWGRIRRGWTAEQATSIAPRLSNRVAPKGANT